MACFIQHIHQETEQLTLSKILTKVEYIMNHFISSADSDKLSAEAFDVMLAKVQQTEQQSLRNLILNHSIGFAVTPSQRQKLLTFLESKSVPLADGTCHNLSKSQRYQIIRQLFKDATVPMEVKVSALEAEMKINFTDMDEKQKVRCYSCLPD